jgi:hypothetical protein
MDSTARVIHLLVMTEITLIVIGVLLLWVLILLVGILLNVRKDQDGD